MNEHTDKRSGCKDYSRPLLTTQLIERGYVFCKIIISSLCATCMCSPQHKKLSPGNCGAWNLLCRSDRSLYTMGQCCAPPDSFILKHCYCLYVMCHPICNSNNSNYNSASHSLLKKHKAKAIPRYHTKVKGSSVDVQIISYHYYYYSFKQYSNFRKNIKRAEFIWMSIVNQKSVGK